MIFHPPANLVLVLIVNHHLGTHRTMTQRWQIFRKKKRGDELSLEESNELDLEPSYSEDSDFSEDMIPKDLPPEIRDEMLRDLAANREDQ